MAQSWITIGSDGTMAADPRAAADILAPLGAHAPLNLVAIFGAARQGKSFLMNCLMRREGTFAISNARDPCTVGIDLSRMTLPIRELEDEVRTYVTGEARRAHTKHTHSVRIRASCATRASGEARRAHTRTQHTHTHTSKPRFFVRDAYVAARRVGAASARVSKPTCDLCRPRGELTDDRECAWDAGRSRIHQIRKTLS